MEGLQDTFADLAAFSLANEFINNDTVEMSLFSSEYISYIYIGVAILVFIFGFLIYKFNYVKRKPQDIYNNEDYDNSKFV